jgi:hypothetical protein
MIQGPSRLVRLQSRAEHPVRTQVEKGVEALERDRIGHVDLNYPRPETYVAANVPLNERQATIALARCGAAGTWRASTGCGSWSRSRPSTRVRTRVSSARRGTRPG